MRLGLSGAPAASASSAVERSETALVELGQAATEDLLDQRILAAEVVIDRGEVGIRGAGDHAHRGAVEAVLHEQALGRIEDAVAGIAGRRGRQSDSSGFGMFQTFV